MNTKAVLFALGAICAALLYPPGFALAQEDEGAATGKPKKALQPGGGTAAPLASLARKGVQLDFPAIGADSSGTIFAAYIAYDGKNDTLMLARLDGDTLAEVGALSKPGNIFQPGLALDSTGALWCVWSQAIGEDWDLLGRRIVDGKIEGDIVAVAQRPGADILPDVKADAQGRVWVAWQAFQGGLSDIWTAWLDPPSGRWSAPIRVTEGGAGDWEPRLAFGAAGEALIVYDSCREGNFDVFLARVAPGGEVQTIPAARSKRYEGRAEAAVGPDRKTLWIAYESGVKNWGKDLGSEWRATGGGLQYDRRICLDSIDLASGERAFVADITPLIPDLRAVLGQPGSNSVCLPEIEMDERGDVWIFYRYGTDYWEIALTKYDVQNRQWALPMRLESSAHCQDRRLAAVAAGGAIYAAWPSDGRASNDAFDSAIYIARLTGGLNWKPAPAEMLKTAQAVAKAAPPPVNATPERPRSQAHEWTLGEDRYTLYWGDFHRHTDFSNCRACDDGCIVEHYRYAYDAAGLDYVATTDHSDQSVSGYSEYEWWQTQKLADMFHTPGFMLAFFGYEREQKGPYGHRNILFAERGGPIVYIRRDRFEKSRWAAELAIPQQAGAIKGDFSPEQVWAMLRESGKRATSISHTPNSADWALIDEIDPEVESVMEIYQGSRMSYEGSGAPQPAVATDKDKSNFPAKAGVYQNALKAGHKLGAFASSDHRSTNISFGGLYAKEFTRDGLFDAIEARRSVAATDKIFMEFSCNGRPMGEAFELREKPVLRIAVEGTAPLARVALIRNETICNVFTPDSDRFEAEYLDEAPEEGENRYYVRVEQTDGNMGWTSPVWVQYSP